jgi:H+/Cl- antiporter ClcA
MRARVTEIALVAATAVFTGVVAGVGAGAFLHALSWTTRVRGSHGWLLYLLPVAGLAIGTTYHYGAGRSSRGMSLVIDEVHEPAEHLPARLAPLIFAAAVVTQLFGGSAGREGVAVLVSAGVSDQLPRAAKQSPAGRRDLLVMAIAAGFGAVFGTPIAGAIFALEVLHTTRIRSTRLLVPCLLAALVGDRVTRALGIHHDALPSFPALALSASHLGRVALLGVLCGAVAIAYVLLVERVKHAASRIRFAPLRPFVGGCIVVVLTGVAGTRVYSGLSVPLAMRAMSGVRVGASMFAWKLVFTAVTLGSGFQGGEVTPLFVMGATMCASVAPALGLPVAVAAALGFVAVFAAASNTPLACTVLAVELFGGHALGFAVVTCAMATLVSTRRSIYPAQRA